MSLKRVLHFFLGFGRKIVYFLLYMMSNNPCDPCFEIRHMQDLNIYYGGLVHYRLETVVFPIYAALVRKGKKKLV